MKRITLYRNKKKVTRISSPERWELQQMMAAGHLDKSEMPVSAKLNERFAHNSFCISLLKFNPHYLIITQHARKSH